MIVPPETPAVRELAAPTRAATVPAHVAAGRTVKSVRLKLPVERSAEVRVSSELKPALDVTGPENVV